MFEKLIDGLFCREGEPKKPLTQEEVKKWDAMFMHSISNGASAKLAAKEADDYIKALRSR